MDSKKLDEQFEKITADDKQDHQRDPKLESSINYLISLIEIQ